MRNQRILDKIYILLEPKEEIEYASFEKNEELSVIVLTNKKIIYTNLQLFKKDIFHFFNIKDNKMQNIERIKKTLQSDENIDEIIKQYFN